MNDSDDLILIFTLLMLQKQQQQKFKISSRKIFAKGVGKGNLPSTGKERSIQYVASRNSLH